MKTPLQELIEKLNNVKPTQFCSIETIRDWAESLLEKEKEVIKEAFIEGDQKGQYVFPQESAEMYYNETFNTKL